MSEWKVGDECWVYSPMSNTHGGSIDKGVLVGIGDIGGLVQIPNRPKPYYWIWCEIFHTREELCAFYRKVFE